MKRLIFFLTIVVCLLVINNLLRDIYNLWHKQDLVAKAEQDLSREKENNENLKAKLTQVKTREFVESEARNKLFLVKPGESKILLPENTSEERVVKSIPEAPNWEKWLKFFGF